jgi:hypothetical protein
MPIGGVLLIVHWLLVRSYLLERRLQKTPALTLT